ncbi:hypothetical protein GCM10028805_45570 [Spirosoma harenae]
MNPFIFLQKSSESKAGNEYMINVNHLIKVDAAVGTGCRILTISGEFYCVESFEEVVTKIKKVFEKT